MARAAEKAGRIDSRVRERVQIWGAQANDRLVTRQGGGEASRPQIPEAC
jgi:hypothetical protein